MVQNKSKNTALITGASGGIGAGIALALAEQGYDLIIVDVKPLALDARNILERHGVKVHFLQSDISISTDRDKIVGFAKHKTDRLDLLVNNAGITKDNLLMRMKADEWNDVINTNLSSIYRLQLILNPSF